MAENDEPTTAATSERVPTFGQRRLLLGGTAVLALLMVGVVGGWIGAAVHDDGDEIGRFHRGMYGQPGERMPFGGSAQGRLDGMHNGPQPQTGAPPQRGGEGWRLADGQTGPQLMRRALKDHLGITDEELKTAMLQAVDDAEQDGELTKSQATQARRRIEDGPGMMQGSDDSSATDDADASESSSTVTDDQ